MLPAALLNSLQNITGFNKAAFEQVHQSGEQVTSIRFNSQKQTNLNHQPPTNHQPIPWCANAYYLPQRPSFTLDPTFHAGAYYVQEASSMFLWQALEQTVSNQLPLKVLDLCAAPGGKSTLLASYFTNGLVISNDVIKSRANILVENITKWGTDNVIVTNNDPKDFKQLPNYFDVIVVDAPCSGSGLFRKDPNAINEWSEANVQLCSQRQQRILADVLPSLKENGLLIYSTCSYSQEEDEQIADLLASECAMQNISLKIDENWGIVASIAPKTQSVGYRFYPYQVKGEGFYLAVFRKTVTDNEARLKETKLTLPSKQAIEITQTFNSLPNSYTFFTHNQAIRALPQQWLQALQQLSALLYIKKAGVELGEVKGKDFIPSHELAVSILPKNNLTTVQLSLDDALQYLRRKEIKLDTNMGWQLVSYDELPLGWVKALPNRVNNYYPQEWRILKS
jgi:16S rRNA C967 or C1407 C5-methylase (RsmB/RsmF family)/NOL1/NOP2/fmu family ribosome biogenesis protein